MTFVLPLVALALAALSWFVSAERGSADGKRGLALLVLTLLGAGMIARYAPDLDRTAMEAGLFAGVIAVALGEFVGGWIAPLALGAAAASALHLLPATTVPAAQMALLGGAGLGALAFPKGGAATALALALVASADNLGMRSSEVAGAAFLGSELGIAAAIGAILASYVPPRVAAVKPVAMGVIVLLGGFVALRSLGEGTLLLSVGIGAAAGVVVRWLLGEEPGESDATRVGLAGIIGIGVATIAFGLGKGVGMALALAAGGGVLLGVGERRGMLAFGPLLGLVLFRVLREAGTGATRALDIGQHYTLLALVLGAVLPLLPTDGLKRGGVNGAASTFLWGLLMLAAPPLVIMMFGLRGAIGFVVGLGLSGLLQAIRRENGLAPLAIGSGLAGATILALKPLAEKSDLARDEKVHLFIVWGVGIVVIAALLAFLSRPAREEAQLS